MSAFPILTTEAEVQVGDMTRLDASRSFVAKSATLDVASVEIRPSLSGSYVNVFGSDGREGWIMDWAYESFAIDINSLNATFKVKEGDAIRTATVAGATYASFSDFATALQTALNAAGGGTYAVTLVADAIGTKMKITGSVGFSIVPTLLSDMCGLSLIKDSSTTLTGDPLEFGWRIASCKVTDNDETPTATEKHFLLRVYTPEGDALWSSDADLQAHEDDIMKWVAPGRATFLNFHRSAQRKILQWLDRNGYTNVYDRKYRKRDVLDFSEFREWSTFQALVLIFGSISNAVDDVFDQKRKEYEKHLVHAQERAILRIDSDADGVQDVTEGPSIGSGTLYRR